MQRSISILLFTACIAGFASIGWSCSCLPVSFDQRICLTATTLEGTVLAKTDNCPGTCDPIGDQMDGMVTYIVRADKIIRGEKPEDGVMYLKTAVNSGLCGIELTVGQKYLFNFDNMQTNMESCPRNYWDVGLCSFPKAVRSLTADETDLLNKLSTGVVSCKDGKIDAFGTPTVASKDPILTTEPSAEPSEVITITRRNFEDEMIGASAEPMVEETPVPGDMISFRRRNFEDEMIGASAEPMVEETPVPGDMISFKRRNFEDEMIGPSAEAMVEESPVEDMELL